MKQRMSTVHNIVGFNKPRVLDGFYSLSFSLMPLESVASRDSPAGLLRSENSLPESGYMAKGHSHS